MNKIQFFIILFLFSSLQFMGQQKLSPKATVSVVTCGPGSELYSTFGHSAFRIYDPLLGLDRIYNYGTFDFNAPNFYMNFVKGKLTYQLSTSSFRRFLRTYQYENRWVKLQELAITSKDKQAVYDFLENNAKPENKDYQYDFFYDNCSTKIEVVIKTILKDKVEFNNSHITSTKTHRDLIADYTSKHQWSKFGIDLALGSVIDEIASKDAYKFLPDYIFEAFDNATIQNNSNLEPLVLREITILKEIPVKKSFEILSPLHVLLVFSLFIIIITYKNHKSKKRTKALDFIMYLLTGSIGVVVLLLWFATSHTATYENYNFLWAFAPNLVVAFYMLKTNLPKWISLYQKLLLVLLAGMVIIWVLQIQVFNLSLLPIVFALAVRYWYLIKYDTPLKGA